MGDFLGFIASGTIVLYKALQACNIPRQGIFSMFLTPIKGYNSVRICQTLPFCSPRTLLHNIDSHAKFEENRKGMPNIESENQFLTSIKGRNSVLICQNLPICNLRTLLSNINSHTKFEENRSRNAKDRE